MNAQNQYLVILALFISTNAAFADDPPPVSGNSGVVNGANVSDFLGSGPAINRDAMDEAAELQDRKTYLDQDPASKPNISLPVGAPPVSTAGSTTNTTAAAGAGQSLPATKQKKPAGPVGKFFRGIGSIFSPNWPVLGTNNDTDKGPDNQNKNY